MIVYYLLGGLFIVLGFFCLLLVIAQLPGSWVMIVLATLIHLADDAWFLPAETDPSRGWWAIGIAVAVALLGELIEFGAGAMGAKVGGGSKRSAWGAIIGGLVGAIALTPIIPIPILWTLVGALVGCFLGALLGEMTGKDPKSAEESLKPAFGATLGRVLGTCCKVLVAVVVWAVLGYGLLSA